MLKESELKNLTQAQLKELADTVCLQTPRVGERYNFRNRQTKEVTGGVLIRDDVQPHFQYDDGSDLDIGFIQLDNGTFVTSVTHQNAGIAGKVE